MRSRILHLLVVSSVWWGVLNTGRHILLLITGIVAVRRRRKNARTPTA